MADYMVHCEFQGKRGIMARVSVDATDEGTATMRAAEAGERKCQASFPNTVLDDWHAWKVEHDIFPQRPHPGPKVDYSLSGPGSAATLREVEAANRSNGFIAELDAPVTAPAQGAAAHKRPVHAAGGRKPIVVDMEAEDSDGTTEHVAEVRAPKQAKSGGVIGALVALLSDGTKRTREQLYRALAEQFPDRATESGGMRNTIGVQLTALGKKGYNVRSDDATARGDKLYWIA